MTSVVVPDLGDFKDVEVIDVLVKPGDKVELETYMEIGRASCRERV